jgi:predicted Zn-dependent protease
LALRAFGLSKPKDYGLLYEAAVFRLAAGQAAKALPLLQELARRPAPQKAWLTALVRAYLETKQPGQARQVLDRLLAGWPGDAALWRLAASLATRRGDYAAAAAALAVAYRLEPPGPTGWRRLGQLYHAAGAPLAAAPFYLKAMAPKPTAPKDLDLLAQLCLQGHDLAAARAWAQKAAAAKATARRWARVGRIAMEQKDYSAARQAYAQAAKLKDKKGRFWLRAGYAAGQGERLEQAGKDFALALERAKPKSSTAKEAARGLKAVRQLIRQRQEG